jgi:hypothetical protein
VASKDKMIKNNEFENKIMCLYNSFWLNRHFLPMSTTSSMTSSLIIPVAFLGIVSLSSLSQSVLAQIAPLENATVPFHPNATTSPPMQNTTTASINPKTAPFEGESIKILSFKSLVKESEWIPIDNYTANGYEIKSIIPRSDKYYVILEKETG